MYAVISCPKYTPATLRVADVGDLDASDLFNGLTPMECPLCGPCSHVEMSWRNYFTCHGTFESVDEAMECVKQMVLQMPGQWDAIIPNTESVGA